MSIETWTPPEHLHGRPPGWTKVNNGVFRGESYLNYCRDCGWASSIALWFTDGGPYCPRCCSAAVGLLTPEHDAPVAWLP